MNNYELILYWNNEYNAFIAEVPELSGCIADRQTYVDAVRNAETAIGEWIETAHYIFLLVMERSVPQARGKLVYA